MVGAENFEISTLRVKAGYSASELRALLHISILAWRRKAFSILLCAPDFLNKAAATYGFRGAFGFRFISTSLILVFDVHGILVTLALPETGIAIIACATRFRKQILLGNRQNRFDIQLHLLPFNSSGTQGQG